MGLFKRKRALSTQNKQNNNSSFLTSKEKKTGRPQIQPLLRKPSDLIGRVLADQNERPMSPLFRDFETNKTHDGKVFNQVEEQQFHLDRLFLLSRKHLAETPDDRKQSLVKSRTTTTFGSPPMTVCTTGTSSHEPPPEASILKTVQHTTNSTQGSQKENGFPAPKKLIESINFPGKVVKFVQQVEACLVSTENLCSSSVEAHYPIDDPLPPLPQSKPRNHIPREISFSNQELKSCIALDKTNQSSPMRLYTGPPTIRRNMSSPFQRQATPHKKFKRRGVLAHPRVPADAISLDSSIPTRDSHLL